MSCHYITHAVQLQIVFPEPGRTIFLAPDEEKPFQMVKLAIKKCFNVNPKERVEAAHVAHALFVAARQARWVV